MIDIIIPVFNGQKYLREAIKSAIVQKNCNVIVVNDGSTDNTRLIMDEFKNKIMPLYHITNKGTAAALNTGIKHSRADWIKWLSADDRLKPSAIKQMMELISIIPLHKKTIFYTHYDIINEHGEKINTFREPNNSGKTVPVLLDHFYGNGSTSLIHRDVFSKCGLFDETLDYQEDYEFWLRAVLIHGIGLELLDMNILDYRIHSGQLTEKIKFKASAKSDEIREKILSQVPQYRNQLGKIRHPIKSRLKRKLVKMLYK